MKSAYYPKSLESGYKKNCWAFLPLQVHQWREGIKGNEQLLSTYCTQWTVSNWILFWNWGSGRSSNLARNIQLLSWRSGPNTKSLTPKLLLFSWSNSWLTWWGFWYSLHNWVRKRLTFYWLLFTVFPAGCNPSEPYTCFLSGPQTFAVPPPRIPFLLPFHFSASQTSHLLQGALEYNSKSHCSFLLGSDSVRIETSVGCVSLYHLSQVGVQILALPHTSLVSLDKSLYVSEPRVAHL